MQIKTGLEKCNMVTAGNHNPLALGASIPGLPPGNDKIRGTLSTEEIFVPKKNKHIYSFS